MCDGNPHRAVTLKYDVKSVTELTVGNNVLKRLIKLVRNAMKDLLAILFLEFPLLCKCKLTQLFSCEVYLHRGAISMCFLQYSLHLIY